VPTAVDPSPPATDGLPADLTAASDRFRGLMVVDLAEPLDRQFPEGAAEAFRRAFPENDATLVVRLIGEDAGVRLERLRSFVTALDPALDLRFVDGPLAPAAELGLLAGADALLALDRAEPTAARVAQSLVLGTPVVATRAGAHGDLFDDGGSELIEAAEVRVERPSGPFRRGMRWAEADLDRAAELLREIRGDPRAVCERIRAAASGRLAERSPAAVAKRVAALLDGS
jgi:glycosyltransferase involved in cell wall biosynthesis